MASFDFMIAHERARRWGILQRMRGTVGDLCDSALVDGGPGHFHPVTQEGHCALPTDAVGWEACLAPPFCGQSELRCDDGQGSSNPLAER